MRAKRTKLSRKKWKMRMKTTMMIMVMKTSEKMQKTMRMMNNSRMNLILWTKILKNFITK